MRMYVRTGILCALVLVMAAPLFAAPPTVSINLSVPGETRDVPVNTTVFTEDLIFSTGAVTATLMGYDVYLQITGPTTNLTITGANNPANPIISDAPSFTVYGSGSTAIYGISDAASSGTPTITDGSVLVQLTFQALAGTTGSYNVNWVFAPSPFITQLYSDTNSTPVTGESFSNGVITFAPVPEPASLGMLGAGALLLVSRRKKVAT